MVNIMFESLAAYMAMLELEMKPSSLNRIKAQINTFLKFCKDSNIHELDDIESTDMDNFMSDRDRKQHEPYGTHGYMKEVSKFFDWCIDKEYSMFWNPLESYSKNGAPKTPFRHCPSKSKVDALLSFINNPVNQVSDRNKCIVQLGLIAGLRTFEISGLTPNSIQSESVTVLGKYNQERELPLDRPTLELIDKYEKEERVQIIKRFGRKTESLFLGRRGTQFKSKSMCRMFHEELQSELTSYDLRHYFCQTMYENGCDLAALSQLMGHSNPNSIASYVQVFDISRKRKMMEEFRPFEGI